MPRPDYVRDGSLILDLSAYRADLVKPGRNLPPTTSWKNLTPLLLADGELRNFAFNEDSGWKGDGTLDDPYRIRANGLDLNDSIEFPNLINRFRYFSTHSWTVEVWMILKGSSSSAVPVLYKPGFVADDSRIPWGLLILPTNRIRIVRGRTFTSESKFVDSATVLNLNSVYHIVGVFQTTGLIYINSILDASGDLNVTIDYAVNYNPFALNSRFQNNGLKAELIALRLYERALTHPEILQNYNAGYVWTPEAPRTFLTNAGLNSVKELIKSNWIYMELMDSAGAVINRWQVDNNKIRWQNVPGTNNIRLEGRFLGSDMGSLPRTVERIRLFNVASGGNALADSYINPITFTTNSEFRVLFYELVLG